MNALMSYHIALLTEYLITHITGIWALTPIYITGITAFSIVYVRLFIQHTLVKIERLSVRIYSDRKKNHFIAVYTLNKIAKPLKNCYLQECIIRIPIFV
jgi:hypothetical protein